MGGIQVRMEKWLAEATEGVAYMFSRPLTRGSFAVQAVLLAIAAIGSPACEIVSGLDELERVDCLRCDGGVRGDSSGDASVSDARARDSSSEQEPAESDADADAGELGVLDSDTGDWGERRSDADADQWDAHADQWDAHADQQDAAADQHDAAADQWDAHADRQDAGADQHDAAADQWDAHADRWDADSQCLDADSSCGSCIVHANGIGQNFSDCTPLGTYNTAQAIKACVAYTGNSLECRAATCGATSVVCSSEAATSCACWAFAGPAAGHVKDSGQAGVLNCMCPGLADPTWN
jgi:hypothetical protein